MRTETEIRSTVLGALEGLVAGDAASRGQLSLTPLVGAGSAGEDLQLVEDGFAAGTFTVEEVDGAGSVPELRVVNRGQLPVLVLEGEEFIGLKQNRTVNSSVLVAAGSTLVIPVSCVERGRWSRRSSRISVRTSASHLALRRLKSGSVHAFLRESRGHASDQGAVWEEVDRKSFRHGRRSETSSLHEARLSLEEELSRFSGIADELPENTRGVIVSIAGRPVAMELLSDSRSLGRAAERLAGGYALEALEYPEDGERNEDPAGEMRDPVGLLSGAEFEEHAAVGDGEDVRFAGGGVAGYALMNGGELLHAAAFMG